MTKDEFIAASVRLGLSLDNMATALGVHRATAFRYARGDIEIPRSIGMAVELLEHQAGKSKNLAGVGTKPQRARRSR